MSEKVVFLQGKRVYLRPLIKEDVPLLCKWINDSEVNRYLSSYLPKTQEDEYEWLESLRKRRSSDVALAIVVKDKMIGTMGIHNIDWRCRTAETGALIGEKDHWNKGYGTEAKMLLLNYAFNTLNLRKLSSSVIAFNQRSHKYSLKCGYKKEGVRKAQYFEEGKYWDEMILAVFKDDFLPVWQSFVKENEIKIS